MGAALGGGYENTAELCPMKCGEAMNGPEKEEWEKAVEVEYEKMQKHNVFQAVNKEDLPQSIIIHLGHEEEVQWGEMSQNQWKGI